MAPPLVHQLATPTKSSIGATSLVGVLYMCLHHSSQLSPGEGSEETGDRDFKLGQPTSLLMGCPAMTLWGYEGGVALIPSAPPGLLLLWLPCQLPQLQVHV